MRSFVLLGVALSMTAPAASMAQATDDASQATTATRLQASSIQIRTVVRDKTGARIGPVINVVPASDGSVASVTVILGESAAKIPGATLNIDGGNLVTSLTRREVAKLR